MDLTLWWESMEMAEQVFWAIAIPSTLIFFILLALSFFGAEAEADFETELDVDTDVGKDGGVPFQFFSFKNMVAFFSIFSWTGIACLDSGFGLGMTILISTIAGAIMMLLMASIFFFMGKMVQSGTMKISNALNKTGEVYLPVPASRAGFGKIQINIQGSIREMSAITDEREDLKQGTVVRVKQIIDGNILLVERSI